MAAARSGEGRPEAATANASFMAGYNARTPAGKAGILTDFEALALPFMAGRTGKPDATAAEALAWYRDADAGAELDRIRREHPGDKGRLRAAVAFFNAASAYEGLLAGARDRMDNAATSARQELRRMTYGGDGVHLQPLTLKDGRQVYLVSGHAAEHHSPAWEPEDPIDSLLRRLRMGNLDPEMSDRTLVVADPGTGRLEMIPARRVRSVGELVPFEGEAERLEAEARERTARREAAEIDGPTVVLTAAPVAEDAVAAMPAAPVAAGDGPAAPAAATAAGGPVSEVPLELNDRLDFTGPDGGAVRAEIASVPDTDGLMDVLITDESGRERVERLTADGVRGLGTLTHRNGEPVGPAAEAETGREAAEEEVDENGLPFVKAADGSTTFGEIHEDSGLTPAPIKLSEGHQDGNGRGYGLAHIEANHGKQIRNAGFASVEDFVSFVAQNYDADNIRVGKRRKNGSPTYLIQFTDAHDNTLFIELSNDGSYWNVNSAGIFRKGYSNKNKKETVAKTEPQQPNNAVSTGSSLSENGEGGIASSEPNGKPTVSAGKVSEKGGNGQEIYGEYDYDGVEQEDIREVLSVQNAPTAYGLTGRPQRISDGQVDFTRKALDLETVTVRLTEEEQREAMKALLQQDRATRRRLLSELFEKVRKRALSEVGHGDYSSVVDTYVRRNRKGNRTHGAGMSAGKTGEKAAARETGREAAEAAQPSGTAGRAKGQRLTAEQADVLLSAMEAAATEAPELELTPENWVMEFGEDGRVGTPVGEVKMGEHQLAKLFMKGRSGYFGMIRPTLEEPDVIVEKPAPSEGAERGSKYLFIKSFTKPDGSRIVHFESVTVRRDGLEVSISSHEAEARDIKKDMQNGNVLHINGKLPFSSEWSLTEAPVREGSDLVPTPGNVSGGKVSENGGAGQGKPEKSSPAGPVRAGGTAAEEASRLEGMPEWHMDAPEDARQRGARRYGGQLFTRQEPVRGVAGRETAVKFSQKDLPRGHVVVMEASQLQPSHVQGQRNPMFFIDEAQPKNRMDTVSRYAAQRIAEGIRPEEITGSVTAYTGAPTVNSRGEVIQGNNRADALRFLWESRLPAQQAAYTQYLIDNAERFGIDPGAVRGMRHPVLVNMLDVSDAEAIRLGQMTAQDTESGGVERIRPKNLAQKLGEGMRQFANMLLNSADDEATFGQLVDLNGAGVMKWLSQTGAISGTQYQSAFDRKGNLTPEARNDLQKVLYQSVFKGGPQQLEELFERLPSKAQRAILATAYRDMDSPSAGKMLHEIQASIVAYSELMRADDFAAARKMENALWAVESFRRQISLDDRFEPYMPADNFSNFALHLAAMYKASDFSQKTIAATFSQMYDLAQGKVGATLFEEADTREHPLAEVIEKVLGIKYKPAKNGNSNVANGGASVALPNQTGQGGEPRGNEPPSGGEQDPPGAGPSERGGRAADDGAAARSDAALTGNAPAGPDGPARSGEDGRMAGRGLSPDEARRVVAWMEESAAVAPELELTPENWHAEFGDDGRVATPIAEVRMGDNQYLKLAQQGRNGKLGMVRPTLERPMVIIEDGRPATDGNGERPSAYVFVRAFVKKDGSRYYHFTSVTVSKDGHEVVISNQEKSAKRISTLLRQGKVAWIDKGFSLHPTAQIEEPVPLNETNRPTTPGNQPALLGINSSEPKVPSGNAPASAADTGKTLPGNGNGTATPESAVSSAGKVSKNAGNGQGNGADFIDDYGEVIAGARKDAMRELARALGAVDIEDLMARPIGQVFKKPDYARMAADGKISRRDALVLETLARSIRPKPRKAMEVERWARDTKALLDLIKKYAEGSEEVRREIHGGIDGHTDRTGTLMHILDGLGFPDAKVGKFSVPEIMPDSQENGHYRVGKRGTRYFEAWGARFGNREEALREALRRVKVGLGYGDIGYTADDFRFTLVPYKIGDKNYFEVTREENGKKSLDAAFPSREEAEAYAAQKNGGAGGGVYAVEGYDRDKGRETVMNACAVIDPYAAEALKLDGVPLFARFGDFLEYKAGHMDELSRKASATLSARYSGTGKTTPGERLKIFGYHNRKTDDYEICVGLDRAYSLGNNSFGNMLTVKTGLRRNEVGPWIEAHREEVAALLAEMGRKAREGQKFIPDRERRGPDYRHGRNVTPEELARTFGFRGVQFGNWASQGDRQAALNNTYDALMDLCHVLGVSPRALSLGGELGIAFGARGSGDANAHYEPGETVINLTRTRGAGSLAHEWWHALDNYFARRGGKPGDYLTEAGGRRFDNVREEMRQAYDGLSKAVERSAYHGRNRSSGYWGIRREETARLFAKWVSGELEKEGRNNDFLASRGIPSEDYKRAMYEFLQGLPGDFTEGKVSFDDFRQRPEALLGYRDPTTEELAELGPKMRGIFDTVREKEEGGHTVLYRLDTELPPESGEGRLAGLSAMDAVTLDREYMEIPLSEHFNPRKKDVRFRLGDPAATFGARQEAAVESRGTVAPGLNGAEVKVVEVPRHGYKGSISEATKEAKRAAKEKYIDADGRPKLQHYDLNGLKFDYEISGGAINESLNPSQQAKSSNKGVHLALATHIDEVINHSVEVEEHPDYEKVDGVRGREEAVNPNALMHRFYGAVEIDGQTYRVMTLMREDRRSGEGNGVHAYEVTKVEVLDNNLPSTPSGAHTPENNLQAYALAKLLRGVEKSHDPGKKLLSESVDLTDFGRFREKASFADGQRLPIAETSEDGRWAYRVEGLGGTFSSREELLDAFREKYPGYVPALEGGVLAVEPWGKYLAGRRATAAERRSEAAYLSHKTRRAREAVAALAAKLNLDGVEVLLTTDGLTGARARAKGWYDPSTGKIVIVLPNHADVGDVVRTLLHEGVAHHGLRQLFGRRFDTFLDNVLTHAAPDVRQEIVSLAARRGWDFRTATEEYLAGLAEDTDFERAERQGWWRRIKEWFLGMLRDLGLPGFSGGALTDSELRYVLWRSYENLRDPGRYRNVFAVAEDVATQSRLGVGDYAAGDGPRESRVAEPARDMASVNARFNEELRRYTEGHMGNNEMFHLGLPQGAMRTFLPNLPIVMRQRVVSKGTEKKHHVGIEALHDMPQMISEPIMIFQRDADTIGILTEMRDREGKNVCVAIEMRKSIQSGKDVLIVNDVRSFHGREVKNIVLPVVNNGTLRWVDKQKALDWLSSASQQAQQEIGNQELSSAAKVVEKFENPAIESEKNESGAGVLFRDGDGDGPLVPSSSGLEAGELASRLSREAARSEAREHEGAAAVRERRGVNVRDAYDRQVAGSAYQSAEALQDSMLGLKTLMMDIWRAEGRDRTGLRHIEDIPAFENAYLAENRMSSANKAQADEYTRDFMAPLLEEVRRLTYGDGAGRRKAVWKRNYGEVTDYMMARHGLERNEVMARREAERKFARERQKVERQLARLEARHAGSPDALESDSAYLELQDRLQDIDGRVEAQYMENRKKDYAGLTGLTGADSVSVAEEKAREMAAAFEASHATAELWRLVNAATGRTLRTLYEAGLLDKARYEEIRGMYAHYIPLRGFADTTSDEVYGYLEGRDALERGNILQRARGRSTKADDPLATMAAMAEAGIAQANRNRMKQAFMNFATNHPSDAVTVGDMWLHYDGADGQWHPVFPDIGAGDDAATVARKLRDFNAAMRKRAREAPEDYLHGKDAVGVPYIIRPGDMREHQVTVRRGGRDFVLTVNGSPRAAQALNGLSNPSSIEGKLLQAAANLSGYVTRSMSQWYTQRNPSFVMGNFIRDMQYANSTVWVKESAAYARRFNLNCAKCNPAALRALFHKYRNGTLDMGKPVEKHFHEFMHEGGETGSCF